MTDHADIRRPQAFAAGHPAGATAYAEHVVRRVLLRRRICIGAEDARLVADAIFASADQVVRRVLRQGFCIDAEDAWLVADAVMAAYMASPAAAQPPQADPGGR